MEAFDLDVITARLVETFLELAAALPLLMLAILVIATGWLIGRWISRGRVVRRLGRRNPLLSGVLETSTRWLITALAIALALDLLNATAVVGALLGTAGILGIVIGFAFKDTLENYLAGLLMSLRQPFAPRDVVEIDGAVGTVIALTSRATILMTPAGNHLRVPNAKVFRAVILNYTRNPQRRFEFDIGVGVHEDLLLACQLGCERLTEIDGVLSTPPPAAFLVSLGDSSVQIRYWAWMDQRVSDFWMIRSEGIRNVKLALEAAGLDLPEPIYRIQLPGAQSVTAQLAQPAAPASGSRAPRDPCPTPDTRAHPQLDELIDRDPGIGSENLLDAQAPRE